MSATDRKIVVEIVWSVISVMLVDVFLRAEIFLDSINNFAQRFCWPQYVLSIFIVNDKFRKFINEHVCKRLF